MIPDAIRCRHLPNSANGKESRRDDGFEGLFTCENWDRHAGYSGVSRQNQGRPEAEATLPP